MENETPREGTDPRSRIGPAHGQRPESPGAGMEAKVSTLLAGCGSDLPQGPARKSLRELHPDESVCPSRRRSSGS